MTGPLCQANFTKAWLFFKTYPLHSVFYLAKPGPQGQRDYRSLSFKNSWLWNRITACQRCALLLVSDCYQLPRHQSSRQFEMCICLPIDSVLHHNVHWGSISVLQGVFWFQVQREHGIVEPKRRRIYFTRDQHLGRMGCISELGAVRYVLLHRVSNVLHSSLLRREQCLSKGQSWGLLSLVLILAHTASAAAVYKGYQERTRPMTKTNILVTRGHAPFGQHHAKNRDLWKV